jgi:hypothetical protein
MPIIATQKLFRTKLGRARKTRRRWRLDTNGAARDTPGFRTAASCRWAGPWSHDGDLTTLKRYIYVRVIPYTDDLECT